MRVLTNIREMRAACRHARSSPAVMLGLVPTMGALHEGHLALVRQARASCHVVAASIFVNPTQFGPNEDLARYPRTFDADCALLEEERVDLLFAPSAEDMYPQSTFGTFVEVPGISERLDGASRPGHLRGVATVVAKLFHIVSPDRAFFGQKDAAQVAVLQAMVRDLDFGVELVVCPTVRDADGLALSSRNRYLTTEQRAKALALARALRRAASSVKDGERSAPALRAQMTQYLSQTPELRLDYAEVVNSRSLLPQEVVTAETLLAVAGWLGDTRLIDNLPLVAMLGEQAS